MITVGELIKELKKYPKDMIVTVWADHSQTPMKATTIGINHIVDLDKFMMEDVCEDDIGDSYQEDELTKVLEIGAP